jgi:hypothetical protein
MGAIFRSNAFASAVYLLAATHEEAHDISGQPMLTHRGDRCAGLRRPSITAA